MVDTVRGSQIGSRPLIDLQQLQPAGSHAVKEMVFQ